MWGDRRAERWRDRRRRTAVRSASRCRRQRYPQRLDIVAHPLVAAHHDDVPELLVEDPDCREVNRVQRTQRLDRKLLARFPEHPLAERDEVAFALDGTDLTGDLARPLRV